jgi:hypothetical protein
MLLLPEGQMVKPGEHQKRCWFGNWEALVIKVLSLLWTSLMENLVRLILG